MEDVGLTEYVELTNNPSCTYGGPGEFYTFINHLDGTGVTTTTVTRDVEDQGNFDICWALVPGKLAETAFLKAGRGHKRVSTQYILDYSCPPGSSVNGANPVAVLEFLKTSGVYLEADYAMRDEPASSDERRPIPPEAEKIFIDDWYPISTNEDNIIAALRENVVLASVVAYPALGQLKGKSLLDMENAKKAEINNHGQDASISHCLLIVGAGFFVPDALPGVVIDYWLVKSSWGDTFGDNGFGYLIRESTLERIHGSSETSFLSGLFCAYVKGEGQKDPAFQSKVQHDVPVSTLTQWVTEFEYLTQTLIFFFYDTSDSAWAGLDTSAHQFITAFGKLVHYSPKVKVSSVNVVEQPDAFDSFQLEQRTELLVYFEAREGLISQAKRYKGPFNICDACLWFERVNGENIAALAEDLL